MKANILIKRGRDEIIARGKLIKFIPTYKDRCDTIGEGIRSQYIPSPPQLSAKIKINELYQNINRDEILILESFFGNKTYFESNVKFNNSIKNISGDEISVELLEYKTSTVI